MARSIDARLARLEAHERTRCERIVQRMKQTHGVTAADMLNEARRVFALSLAEQLAEIDEHADLLRAEGLTHADLAHIRETLTRYYRPMDEYGRACP
jgi:hypothetical protein